MALTQAHPSLGVLQDGHPTETDIYSGFLPFSVSFAPWRWIAVHLLYDVEWVCPRTTIPAWALFASSTIKVMLDTVYHADSVFRILRLSICAGFLRPTPDSWVSLVGRFPDKDDIPRRP